MVCPYWLGVGPTMRHFFIQTVIYGNLIMVHIFTSSNCKSFEDWVPSLKYKGWVLSTGTQYLNGSQWIDNMSLGLCIMLRRMNINAMLWLCETGFPDDKIDRIGCGIYNNMMINLSPFQMCHKIWEYYENSTHVIESFQCKFHWYRHKTSNILTITNFFQLLKHCE